MNAKKLDQIDLELFKVCFPKAIEPRLTEDCITYYVETDRYEHSIMRFTIAIESCFGYIIPEMNRRGFEISLIQIGKSWHCKIYKIGKVGYVMDATDLLPSMATCLAAIEALK